jgi:hypothetical protein
MTKRGSWSRFRRHVVEHVNASIPGRTLNDERTSANLLLDSVQTRDPLQRLFRSQWSLENRPMMVSPKPANDENGWTSFSTPSVVSKWS